MIRSVPRAKISAVDRLVIWVLRRKRSQPYRREQLPLSCVHYRFPPRLLKHRMVERDGKELVWPAGRVIRIAAIHIYQIIKVPAFLEPEAPVERFPGAIGLLRVALRHVGFLQFPEPAFQKFKRVIPERV